MKRLALLFVALSAAPALAQDGAAADANPAVGSVAPVYRQTRDYVLAAAEQMPEAEFGFRPTADVRTFGQLVGHIANAQFAICAAALGESSPASQNFEQAAGKAAVIEGLRASNALCDRAYQQTDAAALQMAQIFGQERTRLSALVLNAAHNFEHYGNMVTYMRIRGMVPPSSQGN